MIHVGVKVRGGRGLKIKIQASSTWRANTFCHRVVNDDAGRNGATDSIPHLNGDDDEGSIRRAAECVNTVKVLVMYRQTPEPRGTKETKELLATDRHSA